MSTWSLLPVDASGGSIRKIADPLAGCRGLASRGLRRQGSAGG